MKLFEKMTQRENKHPNGQTAQQQRQWLEQFKRKTADFLSQRMGRLSLRAQKIALLTFGICMSGTSLLLITRPFHQRVSIVVAPKPSDNMKALLPDQTEDLITHGDYQLLVGYRKTLDSIKLHDPVTFQSLMQKRQGLIDSLDFLIRLYQNQGKALLDR